MIFTPLKQILLKKVRTVMLNTTLSLCILLPLSSMDTYKSPYSCLHELGTPWLSSSDPRLQLQPSHMENGKTFGIPPPENGRYTQAVIFIFEKHSHVAHTSN